MKQSTGDFVNFGDFCRREMGQQSQYGSRYIDGAIPGWANLGKGLRFEGHAYDYHSIKIHKDDCAEFLRRYNQHNEDRMNMDFNDYRKKYNLEDE